MARMHSRRLLFVGPTRKAGPAPIYLAIGSLVFASLVFFIVAAWPEDSTASAHPADEGKAGTERQSFQKSLPTPDSRDSRSRAHWM